MGDEVLSEVEEENENEESWGALIGNSSPGDPAEVEGCPTGKEVVVYSNPPITQPVGIGCSEALALEHESTFPQLVLEFSWDADWAGSVHSLASHTPSYVLRRGVACETKSVQC